MQTITPLYYYLIAVLKHPDKKQFTGGRVCFGSQFKGTVLMAGKAWQEELEVSGHLASTV